MAEKAYTKADVIEALKDPVLQRLSIQFEGMLISGMHFKLVRDHIENDTIKVVSGSSDTVAYYNAGSDTLTTQLGPTPSPYWKRSTLIHECTHALMDILKFKTTRLTNETLAYTTQVAYEVMSDAKYKHSLNSSLATGSQDALWNKFWVSMETFVRAQGFGAASTGGTKMIKNDAAFQALRTQVHGLGSYQALKDDEQSNNNGVPDYDWTFGWH
jgi:hypothetical protein